MVTVPILGMDLCSKQTLKSGDHSPDLNYRLGTVFSKSFIGKILLRIKWKFEITVHFKHEMLGK